MFPDDWAVCQYHAVGINKYRVVIYVMTHQTLSLEKYWKLFSATLTQQFIQLIFAICKLFRFLLPHPNCPLWFGWYSGNYFFR